MDYSKILRALLSKAYKLDAGQLDELLKLTDEGELETKLLDADKTRIGELTKPKAGQTFQDGYKKGKSESLTELETKIKEKYGVEADVTGLDLIDTVVTSKAQGSGKVKELTDDDVKKHPVYQNMETTFKKSLKDKEKEFTDKFTQQEAGFKKGQTLSQVQQMAWDKVEALKPVLPGNTKVAQTIKATFLQSLANFDYDLQDNGPVVMKDGKVVDDGHGHTVAFDDFVKNNAANFFEFANNNGGGNGGNKEEQKHTTNTGAYPTGVVKPKTFDDYAKIMNDTTIKVEDRQKVAEVWDSEHSAI